jgi:hypothetical protein
LPAAELEAWRGETIEPAVRAMTSAYFATTPSEPVVVLLFATEAGYREHAARLFGDREVSRYGYYRPHLRTVMVNAECGPDALVHELTHALMAFDFPAAPEWLGEGLASLHEHGRIRDDGGEILGLPNWRLGALEDALRQGRLPPLRSLLGAGSFRGPDERLNYARARYFCMYLQSRGVLRACYRACRAGRQRDPTGEQAVAALFPGLSWEQLDADFRAWLGRLTYGDHPSGSVAPLGSTTTRSRTMPYSVSSVNSTPRALTIRALRPMRQFLSMIAPSIRVPAPTPRGGWPAW